MAAFSRFLSAAVVGFGLGMAGVSPGTADPAPVYQLNAFRASVFDWQGPYGGVLFSLQSFETGLPDTVGPPRVVDGNGHLAGLVAGYNFSHGPWVAGLEADIGYGQLRAARAGHRVKADVMGLLRTRIGRSFDDNLIYATAGASFAAVNRSSALMMQGDTSTHIGLIVGGGIEHALAPTLTGRLEYLYGHTLENRSSGLDDMHIVRAGAVYHFPN